MGCERFLYEYLPWMMITLLNILTFGCYIYNAFMFILWLLIVILVNELEIMKKMFNNDKKFVTDNLHHLIIITLFLANFGNSQNSL
jgi:hypothetical protein